MKREVAPHHLASLAAQSSLSESDFDEMIERLSRKREGGPRESAMIARSAETLAESVIHTGAEPAPDCRECGACCAHFQKIPVSKIDPTPRLLTWLVRGALDPAGAGLRWMKRDPYQARCVALAGAVGERVRCDIYELRPGACREFEAGSDRCHAVRRLYGLEPRLSKKERDKQARLLAARARARGDRAEDEVEDEATAPDLQDAAARIGFLKELIAYNAGKVREIIAELGRLEKLFKDRAILRVEAKCKLASRAIEKGAQSVAAAMEGLQVQFDARIHTEESLKELSEQLLRIGRASQAVLEHASERLAEVGAIAYERMKSRK